jgi:predicted esterase
VPATEPSVGKAADPVTPPPASASLSVSGWPPPAPDIVSDFCIDVMHALDEETCYVLPAVPTEELLLYLHGIIPPGKTSVQKTNLETVVANAARRNNVAVLLPRGRRGLSPRGREDWWGWPTSAISHARLADELVASFADKRRKLEALIGKPFARLYLAGSSSGAYLAVALALNGELEADGFAALSGGAWPAQHQIAKLAPRPFYVGYGQHDSVATGARSLGERLRRAGWPVKVAIHAVPHGAREIYLDEALAFFRDQLSPTHAPR